MRNLFSIAACSCQPWDRTDQRADCEHERADRLVTELLRATADTLAAKEAAAGSTGELSALRWPLWWRRLAG
jgi:hypothetical protein